MSEDKKDNIDNIDENIRNILNELTDEARNISEKDIRDAIAEGMLPNNILWNHYKNITECNIILDETLDGMKKFKPFEIYYAYITQLYYLRFAFEDMGPEAEDMMKKVDAEVFRKMFEYRKKYPKGHMHKLMGEFQP